MFVCRTSIPSLMYSEVWQQAGVRGRGLAAGAHVDLPEGLHGLQSACSSYRGRTTLVSKAEVELNW